MSTSFWRDNHDYRDQVAIIRTIIDESASIEIDSKAKEALSL